MKTKSIDNYKIVQSGKTVRRFMDGKLKESVTFDYLKDANKCFRDTVKMTRFIISKKRS